MLRLPVLVLIASTITTGAMAKDRGCTLKNNYCVPFIGCSLKSGDFYHGFTMGRRDGPVVAQSKSGVTCTGKWWRNAVGAGRAKFSCDNGASGSATYTYFDSSTGTATGRGRTNQGDKLRFWAGPDVLGYVLSQDTETQDMLACVKRATEAAKEP